MKILFLGDSITEGVAASCEENKYVNVFARLSGAEVVNYGVGGTRIAKQKVPSSVERWDYDFLSRAFTMEEDADLVFVFGGTNDFGHGDAAMGERNSSDPYTFCGAFNNLLNYLAGKYGKEKLIYILPLHRSNENNPKGDGYKTANFHILAEYVQAEKDILTGAGINYIDVSERLGIPPTNTPTEYFTDGLHPNDVGHRIIAEEIYAYLLSNGYIKR